MNLLSRIRAQLTLREIFSRADCCQTEPRGRDRKGNEDNLPRLWGSTRLNPPLSIFGADKEESQECVLAGVGLSPAWPRNDSIPTTRWKIHRAACRSQMPEVLYRH